jgi:hypothetical protein
MKKVNKKPSQKAKVSKSAPPQVVSELALPQVVVNGGVLVRAAEIHECNTPNCKDHKIKVDDGWTCPCGQRWRAKNAYPPNPKSIQIIVWRRLPKLKSAEEKAAKRAEKVEKAQKAQKRSGLIPSQRPRRKLTKGKSSK